MPFSNQGRSRTNSVSLSLRTQSLVGSYAAINLSTQQVFPTISPLSTYTQKWKSIAHCDSLGVLGEEITKTQQLTSTDQAAVDFFKSTTTRDESGRFVVRLPFDTEKQPLGESLISAIRRLRSMEKRFERDPEFHQK